MKRIEAIIRSSKVAEVQKALAALDRKGMTTWEVRGNGQQKGHTSIYKGSEYQQPFVGKAMVVIFCEDELVEEYISTILRVAPTGEIGDGVIAVTRVEQLVRIRTREVL